MTTEDVFVWAGVASVSNSIYDATQRTTPGK